VDDGSDWCYCVDGGNSQSEEFLEALIYNEKYERL